MISNLIFTGYNYAKGKNNYAEDPGRAATVQASPVR